MNKYCKKVLEPIFLHIRVNLQLISMVCFCCFGAFYLQPVASAAEGQAATTSPAISDLHEARNKFEQRRQQIAAQMEGGTVFVLVEGKDGSQGLGSGFVVGNGFILTNAHVASKRDAKHVFVRNEHLPLTEAYVVASTPPNGQQGIDFALLRFEPPRGVNLPILAFNTEIQRTDRVSVWGYPFMVLQFDKSKEDSSPPPVVYTEGTVSAIVHNPHANIIHSAAIAAGNSGGPLINRNGEVVGINTWGSTEEDEGAFVNASLPTASILPFLEKNGVVPIVVGGRDGNTNSAKPQPTAEGGKLSGGANPFFTPKEEREGLPEEPLPRKSLPADSLPLELLIEANAQVIREAAEQVEEPRIDKMLKKKDKVK